MAQIFLPPSVSRELRDRTQSFNAAVRESVRDYDPHDSVLRRVQPGAGDDRPAAADGPREASRSCPGLPMKPGYYHIICDNSDRGAPDTVMIVEGAHGEFTEPDQPRDREARRRGHARPAQRRPLRARPGGRAPGQRARAARRTARSAASTCSTSSRRTRRPASPAPARALDAEPGRPPRPRRTRKSASREPRRRPDAS